MRRRQSQAATDKEARVQQALKGIQDGTYRSAYHAAQELKLSTSTLSDRLRGRESRADARSNQQNLTPPEEHALLKWVTQLTITGYPAKHSMLREMAEEIRKKRVMKINDISITLVSYPPIGINWVSRFVTRHPQLQTVLVLYMEAARIKGATPNTLNQFFNAFIAIIEKFQITMENIYNIDETGCALRKVKTS